MNITVEKIPYEKKALLVNLMELYNYDFSEFENTDVNEFGLYGYKYIDHYWVEEGRYPYLVKVDSQIAGFVLVRELGLNTEKIMEHSIAEFFIMKKYRGKSIGKKVAFKVFNMFQGLWRVKQIEGNIPAQHFWRSIIKEFTQDNYMEIRENGWDGPIQTFYTRDA